MVSSSKSTRQRNWFERAVALLSLANLGLVAFDLSYVPWRNVYLARFPALTRLYDPVKGIEPHRDTQRYLQTVDQLKIQVASAGLQAPETELTLRRLRLLSRRMIEDNPFQEVNKTGTLVKIKNRMRDQVGNESAQEAFTTFWSQTYLSGKNWQTQMQFFDAQVRPLIATNYYRPVGENNEFVDYFWLLDLPFMVFLGLELLARTYYLSRRPGVQWLDALLWRWYDWLFFLPFWRWLRVIPVVVRLDQSGLINLNRIRTQINHSITASLAEELTKAIVIRVLGQLQESVQRGDLAERLLRFQPQVTVRDVNNVNEVEEIANLLVNRMAYQVIPQILPDVEAILRHNIESALKGLPFYQAFQQIPGVGELPAQMTERLVTEGTQATYKVMLAALEDSVGAALTQQLIQHLTEAIASQVQDRQNLQRVQDLVTDLLEEVKLSYVKRWGDGDLEMGMALAEQLGLNIAPQLAAKPSTRR